MENEKLLAYPDPNPYYVWSTYITAFVSYLAHRTTERMIT